MTDITLTDHTLTEEQREEVRMDILAREDDFLSGLLDAASYADEETKTIEIWRKGKFFFKFDIHPISEELQNDIRKKYTKYAKNRRQGIKVAEELDSPSFRLSLIYNSTVERDQAKLWDNKKVAQGLEAQGKTIINALDVIKAVLLPGEIDRIMDCSQWIQQ